jgi:CheY-like chemotaxis protein
MDASSKLRILAVDDHPLIRGGLSASLGTETGMEVVAEASNGEEAIERYREFRPDVVLMDLSMPVMDGLAATRSILAEFPEARIIVLTTYDGDEDIHRALDAGARGCLLKGMLVGEMTALIRAVSQSAKSADSKSLKPRPLKVSSRPPTELADVMRGRYVIERELGRGGMATVYLAHDLRHDRDVALKVLRPELSAVLGRERFLTEIRLTAKLDHPHILTLIDSGESSGFLWYVIPYVRGESLRDRLNRQRQLPWDEALTIIKQIGSALDYAHQHDIIHRDIKPENILFHEGEAMLADFGIALGVTEAGGNRVTETGLSLGTPQYMSPEQATGDRQLDSRTDVYSLGAVLYEMLAGEPPHTGATAQAVIAKLITEPPTRLRVLREALPESVDTALAKALAKVPADRFARAITFVEALDRRPSIPVLRLPLLPASVILVIVLGAALVIALVLGW